MDRKNIFNGIMAVLIFTGIASVVASANETELTVYNQNLGLVKEKRVIKLEEGLNKIEFTDVSAQIDPVSVHFKSLTAPDKCFILEQSFEYDLVNRQKLLQKYIGKEIEIERRLGEEGKIKELIKGSLLSITDGITVKVGDKIILNPEGEISLSKLPEGLILKPTLSWLIQNEKPGEHDTEVTYLTGGISWLADYVIVLDKDDSKIDLNGWVTIDNKSGAVYKDAKLKLIAGDVNRVEPSPMRVGVMAAMKYSEEDKAFEEKTFFEYHMYTLQRRATINDNETKQIEFVKAGSINVKKLYIYRGFIPQYWFTEYSRSNKDYGAQCSNKVFVNVEFVNSKENNLGIPLPKGKIRVYKKDIDESLEFIGEDAVEHTPKDESIRVYLGNAFDIVGERTQKDFKYVSAKTIEETFQIKLRNHKEEPVEVTVTEQLYRWSSWKILNNSLPYEKKDSKTIEFKVKVDKNSETVLDYTVRYWWD